MPDTRGSEQRKAAEARAAEAAAVTATGITNNTLVRPLYLNLDPNST